MSTAGRKRFRFTIVAGALKGKKITAPDYGDTRPPLSRLRRAVFDFLQPRLEGAAYLDLFSGTGSYLFEAVSRGAVEGLGVERDHRLASAIGKEAERLGVADRLECLTGDVFEVLPRLAERGRTFDIVMVAPPQYEALVDQTLASLAKYNVGTENSLIVCQHDSAETGGLDLAGFDRFQERKYGNTTFTVLRYR
jgi:16S rRNA (guanine(966)-N(2))-methyltransferase RsmD